MNLKIAILDLYNGQPNEGMRCIRQLLTGRDEPVEYTVFDVRGKGELPGLEFDAYISSGGPGDPAELNSWNPLWSAWINSVLEFNRQQQIPKQVLLICHSFQLMCLHQKIGRVSLRHSPSFGILPVHKTTEGTADLLLAELPDPFYAVDSRSYQVLIPKTELPAGYKILAVEKIRIHVPYQRAIMALEFSAEITGTQFHPEADPEGMGKYFQQPEKKTQIIAEHGLAKYTEMMLSLHDPQRLILTYQHVIPTFLGKCIPHMNTGDDF